jgi:NADPH:quinone reductase-like Zn-dependent oxidoreductase
MSSPTPTTDTPIANGQPTTTTKPKRIKTIVLTSTGSGNDYSNLQIKEEDWPKIEAPNQVIVRVKASGLNFAELMQRQGLYKPTTKTPYTQGYEASGIVEEVGSEVTDLKVNDRVVVFGGNGMWKEVVRVPRLNVVKIPDEMTFEDAAGLIVNYVTAYQLLFRMANLQPNDVVLIHMAAGSFLFFLGISLINVTE